MTSIDIRRKNTLNLFREAPKLGSFDEFPVLRRDVDPQLHVSRNQTDQPFYLILEKDCMVALVSGRATVHFTQGSTRYFELEPGDFVYVPGGIAHKIEVHEEGIQLRYKARDAGLEAVAWYCNRCATQVYQHVWNTADMLPQEGYINAVEQFNSYAVHRVCPQCGEVHPPVDSAAFRWHDVAHAIRADGSTGGL